MYLYNGADARARQYRYIARCAVWQKQPHTNWQKCKNTSKEKMSRQPNYRNSIEHQKKKATNKTTHSYSIKEALQQ